MAESAASERWLLPSLRSCLAGPEQAQWRRWLGRGRRLVDGGPGPRLAIGEALGLPLAQVPWVGALATADLGSERGAQAWLRLDRVRLQVDGFSLRLAGLLDQPWSGAQQQLLAECLEALPGAGEWTLRAGLGGRSYLCTSVPPRQLSLPPSPATMPPDALLGADLLDALPAERSWRRWLNDCQVALSPLDLAQAGHGVRQSEAPWLWGDARLEVQQAETGWGVVEDPELRALLRHLGCAEAVASGAGLREGTTAQPSLIASALRRGPLWLGFACGARFVLRPRDRWRLWRAGWRSDDESASSAVQRVDRKARANPLPASPSAAAQRNGRGVAGRPAIGEWTQGVKRLQVGTEIGSRTPSLAPQAEGRAGEGSAVDPTGASIRPMCLAGPRFRLQSRPAAAGRAR